MSMSTTLSVGVGKLMLMIIDRGIGICCIGMIHHFEGMAAIVGVSIVSIQ